MKLRSDFREAVTFMNRPHRESGEERFLFMNTQGGIRRLLHPVNTPRQQWNEHWWSSSISSELME